MALVIGEVKPGFLDGHPENGTLILLPPKNGGAIGWGDVFLSFGADLGDSRLRVAVWNDNSKSWRVDTLDVKSNEGRVGYLIHEGDSKVSIGRIKSSAADTGTNPVGYLMETTLRAL